MKDDTTHRGFSITNFTDRYGVPCSIQKTSLATEDSIWFGVDDADPKIMASDAKKLGIMVNKTTGWVHYPIPEEVLLTTQMHLTQDQVKELLPYLERFANTGELHLPKFKKIESILDVIYDWRA